MFSVYVMPIAILLSIITSFYFLRKSRDKKFVPSLILFLIPFALDIALGIETSQPYWAMIVKAILLTLGWLSWFRAFTVSKK